MYVNRCVCVHGCIFVSCRYMFVCVCVCMYVGQITHIKHNTTLHLRICLHISCPCTFTHTSAVNSVVISHTSTLLLHYYMHTRPNACIHTYTSERRLATQTGKKESYQNTPLHMRRDEKITPNCNPKYQSVLKFLFLFFWRGEKYSLSI
jgi:hypothetical protein